MADSELSFHAAPNTREQVLRFAVGAPDGPRSRTWRLWVPPNKSDVYLSSRKVAYGVKVSLHEPGPSRFALTKEYAAKPDALRPAGDDPRGAHEWERPRPQLPDTPMTRPFAIIVPWDEVIDRGYPEKGDVVWTPAPREGMCVEYDLLYTAAGLTVDGYPGARSMGTELVGKLNLANGEQLFVVAWTHEMDEKTVRRIERFRGARIFDGEGNPVPNTGFLAFGVEDGVGFFLDVTHRQRELSNAGAEAAG